MTIDNVGKAIASFERVIVTGPSPHDYQQRLRPYERFTDENLHRGSNLTIVAPTNSPAADKLGNVRTFGGTSCANPNLAGMASLRRLNIAGSQVVDLILRVADGSLDESGFAAWIRSVAVPY